MIDYQEMQNRLAVAGLITLDQDAWQATEDYIDNLHQAREKIQEAARAYEQGNYLSAMAVYMEVLAAGQFLQEEAAAGLESSIAGYPKLSRLLKNMPRQAILHRLSFARGLPTGRISDRRNRQSCNTGSELSGRFSTSSPPAIVNKLIYIIRGSENISG